LFYSNADLQTQSYLLVLQTRFMVYEAEKCLGICRNN